MATSERGFRRAGRSVRLPNFSDHTAACGHAGSRGGLLRHPGWALPLVVLFLVFLGGAWLDVAAGATMSAAATPGAALSAIPVTDFEAGWGFWYADNGVWDIGPPTSGPGNPHGGVNCAATNLSGNYPLNTASRLISPFIDIPLSGPNAAMWLKFWHWFSIYDAGDIARVQIKPQGDTTWTDISLAFAFASGAWTVHRVSLEDYEGMRVQIGFLFDDDGATSGYPYYSPYTAAGWYLDDISLVEIQESYWTTENFEGGVGEWYAEKGIWEVGSPTSGPGAAYQGSQAAASILAGNYTLNCDSRLISPPLALPATPADGVIRLKLAHWFSVYSHGDLAVIEARAVGGSWGALSGNFAVTSGAWTQYVADLSPFAGQTVELAFRLRDDGATSGYPYYSHYVAPGWYLDALSIEEGAAAPWTPCGFEGGAGDWYADNGIWGVGSPSSGPNRAAHGSGCAASVLGGNYTLSCDSRLISPPIALDPAPPDGALWLSFWHWFSIYDAGDLARVEVRPSGGAWEVLSNSQAFTSGAWTRQIIDISHYAGQTVQVGFHLRDDGATSGYPYYNWYVSAGWYVDDVEVLSGDLPLALPEHFEDSDFDHAPNQGAWCAEGGIWQIGKPTSGPASSHDGQYCAATLLTENYRLNCDARLISPQLVLPASPVDGALWLSFWHWYSIYDANDLARVEIRLPGGAWQPLSRNFAHTSGFWTQHVQDLAAFAGQTIQLAWHLRDDGATSGYPYYSPYVSAGWYVDEIAVQEGSLNANNVEDFEDGSVGWAADASVWQIGEPPAGYGPAHSGLRCAGTVLGGNYLYLSNSRLVSPAFVVPASAMMRFFQKFSFYGGDSGNLEISVAGGAWTTITTFVNESPSWSQYVVDLSPYAGQSVRLGFRIYDDGATTGYPYHTPLVSWGWYIDDFYVLGLPEGKPAAPTFLSVDYSASAPVLRWSGVPAGARGVAVYAGFNDSFTPDFGNRIAVVNGNEFQDIARPGWHYRYKIATIDIHGHESVHVLPVTMTEVDTPPAASITALRPSFPNPFNPVTTLRFSLRQAGRARLGVYDVRGRLVERLVDGDVAAGWHEVQFDGRQCASGVYFARLEVGGVALTEKMTLVK